MGMAASQARFLSLTARKSNVEYQGQQVNQERTALANESANLFTQLNSLEVPTPPIVENFKKTEYSFTSSLVDGENKTFTLNEVKRGTDGDFVTLYTDDTYYNAALANLGGNGASIVKQDITEAEKTANKNGYTPANYTINTVLGSYPVFKAPASNFQSDVKYISDVNNGGNDNFKNNYLKEDGSVNGADIYFYVVNGTRYYLDLEEMNKAMGDTTGSASVNTALYVVENTKKTQKEYKVDHYETNDLGRITSIKIQTDRKNGDEQLSEEFQLTMTTVQDEDAYEQAMLDYEYQKAAYEKATSDINSKTEKIQADDKTLELHLKQLDTEQNAIKTELEAVKAVAKANVESTFKTFG